MAHRQTAGFTLIEVLLGIVLGIVVLSGAVTLYREVSQSTRNAMAQGRLVAVGEVAEAFSARNSSYPTLAQLRLLWKAERPKDYDKSPWGDLDLTSKSYIEGKDDLPAGTVVLGDGQPEPPGMPGADTGDFGRIYYFRTAGGSRNFWIHDHSFGFGPVVTRLNGFGLTYVGPEGEHWYLVVGNRSSNAPDAGP